MLKKSLVKIALVSGGNIANALLGFFYLAIVAKNLPLDDFGKYALLTSLLLVFVKLIDFGSNSIYVTKFLTEEESKVVTDNFHSIKALMLALTTPIALGIIIIFFPAAPALYLIFAAGLVAYTLNFTFYAHFQKEEKFIPLVLLNTLPAIVKAAIAVMVLANVVSLTMLNSFAFFSLAIFADLLLIPFLPAGAKTFRLNLSLARNFLTKGIPSGFSQIVQEGWPALNNTITKFVRDYNEVGAFSMASKISNIFALVSLSIFAVLLPKNARLKGQKKSYDLRETLFISAGVLLLAFAVIGVAGIFIRTVFESKFEGSLKVLDILIFAAAFTAIHTFIENYFVVESQNKYILWINSVKLMVFGVSVFFLGNPYGIEGLAYANLLAAVVAVFVTAYTIIRKPNETPVPGSGRSSVLSGRDTSL